MWLEFPFFYLIQIAYFLIFFRITIIPAKEFIKEVINDDTGTLLHHIVKEFFKLQNFIRLVTLCVKEMVIVWNWPFRQLINNTTFILRLLVHFSFSPFRNKHCNCLSVITSGGFPHGCPEAAD